MIRMPLQIQVVSFVLALLVAACGFSGGHRGIADKSDWPTACGDLGPAVPVLWQGRYVRGMQSLKLAGGDFTVEVYANSRVACAVRGHYRYLVDEGAISLWAHSVEGCCRAWDQYLELVSWGGIRLLIPPSDVEEFVDTCDSGPFVLYDIYVHEEDAGSPLPSDERPLRAAGSR